MNTVSKIATQKKVELIKDPDKEIYFVLRDKVFKGLDKKDRDYFVRYLFNKKPYAPGTLLREGYVPYHKVLHCAQKLIESKNEDKIRYIPQLFNAFGYIYKSNGGKYTPELRTFLNTEVSKIKFINKEYQKNSKFNDLFSVLTSESKKLLKHNIEAFIKKSYDEKNVNKNLYNNLEYDPKSRKYLKTTNESIASLLNLYEIILFDNLREYKKIPGKTEQERVWSALELSSIKDNNPKQNRRQSIDRKLIFLLVFVLELDRKETEKLFDLADCFLDKEGKYLVEDKILWELIPFLSHLKHLAVKIFAEKLDSFDKIENTNTPFSQW